PERQDHLDGTVVLLAQYRAHGVGHVADLVEDRHDVGDAGRRVRLCHAPPCSDRGCGCERAYDIPGSTLATTSPRPRVSVRRTVDGVAGRGLSRDGAQSVSSPSFTSTVAALPSRW